MRTGTIKFFNDVQGYGFISPDKEGEKDVFFHFSGMKDNKPVTKFDKGKLVEYGIKEGKNGPEADAVVILPGSPKKSK